MTDVNRVVVGASQDKKSAVLYRDSPNQQEEAGIFWRSTLWATTDLPADNTIPGGRGADACTAPTRWTCSPSPTARSTW